MLKKLSLLPFLTLVASAFCFASATAARASVILKMKEEHFSKETRTCEMVVAVEESRGRVDTDCGPKKISVITLKGSKKMTLVDFGNKSYFEMDTNMIEKMASDPMEALKSDPRFSAQMAKMTPEQKAMMQKMMAGALKKNADTKAELKKLGKTKKIGTWNCTTYGVYLNGQLSEDLCLADLSQFPALTPVMGSWRSFMSSWLKMSQSPTLKAHEEASKIGIAVETLIYQSGEVKSKTDLVEVKSEARPDSFFQAPGDFKKAASPLMGQ